MATAIENPEHPHRGVTMPRAKAKKVGNFIPNILGQEFNDGLLGIKWVPGFFDVGQDHQIHLRRRDDRPRGRSRSRAEPAKSPLMAFVVLYVEGVEASMMCMGVHYFSLGNPGSPDLRSLLIKGLARDMKGSQQLVKRRGNRGGGVYSC